MIASLAMYDPPWLRPANDLLWAFVAAHLRSAGIADVPDRLTRGADLDAVWRSPSLLLAQTCGYPLTTHLHDVVQLVATPCYDADGADGALHRSAIVVRADDPAAALADLAGRRAGINGRDSNSGANLLRATIAPLARDGRFFGSVQATGSHARSLAALLSARIDVAAIDCVTLALLRDRYPREAERLRILAWSPATPGLPLVTRAHTPPETLAALRRALTAAASDPALAASRTALRLVGFAALDLAAYGGILAIEREAAAQGYPDLR